jgi:hypothetical protein
MKSKTDVTTRHNFNIRTPYWKMNEYEIQDRFHYKTQIQYKTLVLNLSGVVDITDCWDGKKI